MMEVDKKVRAKEFMYLMNIGRTKFYELINTGEIKEPIRVSRKDVFWYLSYVKEKVEEHKPEDAQDSVIIAHI